MRNGFIFLMIATGVMSFLGFMLTMFALDDHESYAKWLVALEFILVITFLTTGFIGFSGL